MGGATPGELDRPVRLRLREPRAYHEEPKPGGLTVGSAPAAQVPTRSDDGASTPSPVEAVDGGIDLRLVRQGARPSEEPVACGDEIVPREHRSELAPCLGRSNHRKLLEEAEVSRRDPMSDHAPAVGFPSRCADVESRIPGHVPGDRQAPELRGRRVAEVLVGGHPDGVGAASLPESVGRCRSADPVEGRVEVASPQARGRHPEHQRFIGAERAETQLCGKRIGVRHPSSVADRRPARAALSTTRHESPHFAT